MLQVYFSTLFWIGFEVPSLLRNYGQPFMGMHKVELVVVPCIVVPIKPIIVVSIFFSIPKPYSSPYRTESLVLQTRFRIMGFRVVERVSQQGSKAQIK